MLGLRELSGSWNTSWMRRRTSQAGPGRVRAERLLPRSGAHPTAVCGGLRGSGRASSCRCRSRRQRPSTRRSRARTRFRVPRYSAAVPFRLPTAVRDTPPRGRSPRGWRALVRPCWLRYKDRRCVTVVRGAERLPARQQLTCRAVDRCAGSDGGISRSQRSIRMSQRGANGHPAGLFHGSTALPGIPRSSRVSAPTRGTASSSRRV